MTCLIITAIVNVTISYDLKCDVKASGTKDFGKYKVCYVKDMIITAKNETIKLMNGNPKSSKLKAIEIKDQTMNFFLKRIGKFFPDMKFLRARNTQLKTIGRDDFKFMTQLEWIDISGQEIQSLDGNLFTFTPKLRFISFTVNKLQHVGPGLLKKLDNVQKVSFSFNACIDRDAKSKNEIAGLILEMEKTCPKKKMQTTFFQDLFSFFY